MMQQYHIGIIGMGFVGSAIFEAHRLLCEATCIDPLKGYANTYKDIKDCAGVYICVPSPQGDDGSCDTSILEEVLEKLKEVNYHGVIISKCTAPPKVYENLQSLYPNLVHIPEFLTAANANADYLNGKFAFIGGEVSAYRNEAERIIRVGQGKLEKVTHCSIAEAALAKYTINCFLATKVTFMNELSELAKNLNCNYQKIASMVVQDHRIGPSHMQVPGPDGQYGFGGYCFPKDTSSLLKIAEQVNSQMSVLDAAVKKNILLRLTDSK